MHVCVCVCVCMCVCAVSELKCIASYMYMGQNTTMHVSARVGSKTNGIGLYIYYSMKIQ